MRGAPDTNRRVRYAHQSHIRDAMPIRQTRIRLPCPLCFETSPAMPRYRRAHIPGGTYFFTVVTLARQPILLEPEIRAALREAVILTSARYPFHIDAWVLLPEHLHCIWTLPEGDDRYGMRWSLIKRHVTQAAKLPGNGTRSRVTRREGNLWQRRYWEHVIRDEHDFERHVDYIHWNPVKHGLVQTALEWPYSTFHRYVRQGVYAPDWGTFIDYPNESFGDM